jgi:hypothetical protein
MRIPIRDGRRRRRIVGLLFGVWTVAAIAACGSGASAQAPMGAGGSASGADRQAAAASAAPAGLSGNSASGPAASSGNGSSVGGNGDEIAFANDAKIVRTGSLEVEVADVTKALSAGRDAIRSIGGYIGASQQQRSSDQIIATVTYRIPVARWEETLDALRGLGTVVSEKTDATEVTAQLVDLDARIRNLKASEQALVGYVQKAPKVSDLLEIQSRLTDTRGEIERLSAQQANLQDQAALATLTVTFGVKAVAVTQVAGHWDPAAEVDRASAILIGIGQAVVSFAIVFAIVWLPVLVVLGIIVLIAMTGARRIAWRGAGDPPVGPPAVSPPA